MKHADGMAAFQRATHNLAPLLDSSPDDEVYRAFPDDPSGVGSRYDSHLLAQYRTARNYYGEQAAREDRMHSACLIGSVATSVLLGLYAWPAIAANPALDTLGEFAGFTVAVISVLATAAALLLAINSVMTFSFKRGRGMAEILAELETADFSQMVEVVNPDEATALALDRANAHAMTARGPALARARQHYYDLMVEVATGAAGTTAGTRAEQWTDAWRRWCAIDDAWTDIVCDPLAALHHSELLDVTLPRTAAFVTAYADAREAMTGRTAATVPVDLSRLLRLVDTTETAWVEAREHAEHAGYAWLPEAERKKAATAEAAIMLAMDKDAPMGERANAAAQAARLLGQITTVRLPKKARGELDTVARKAITAAPAPILRPIPKTSERLTA
jgi:hypothetical protein